MQRDAFERLALLQAGFMVVFFEGAWIKHPLIL